MSEQIQRADAEWQHLLNLASADLDAAQKRIAELEAQVAQHPERLQETARRVAEAVFRYGFSDAYADGEPIAEVDQRELDDIIAEATKP